MVKRRFDPSTIQEHQTVGGLSPTDFMRPLSQEPLESATPQAPTKTKDSPKPTNQAVSKPQKVTNDLPMPPSRKTEARVTVIFRASSDLDKRLKTFCQEHDASIQDTVTLAIEEFLDRRSA